MRSVADSFWTSLPLAPSRLGVFSCAVSSLRIFTSKAALGSLFFYPDFFDKRQSARLLPVFSPSNCLSSRYPELIPPPLFLVIICLYPMACVYIRPWLTPAFLFNQSVCPSRRLSSRASARCSFTWSSGRWNISCRLRTTQPSDRAHGFRHPPGFRDYS